MNRSFTSQSLAILLIAACLCLSATQSIQAATINVPADQSTIQAGIDAASDGDTVLVSPGTYIENIDYSGKSVVLGSVNGPEVTVIQALDVLAPVVTIYDGPTSGVELSGFTVTGSNNTGIYCFGSSPRIVGNVITGNTSIGGNNAAGLNMKNTVGSVVEFNTFHGNTGLTSSSFGVSIHLGDDGRSSTADTIRYNVMFDNLGVHEIRVLGIANDVMINNNTISASPYPGNDGGTGILVEATGETTVANNIVSFAPFVGIYANPAHANVRYNCTFANNIDYYFSPGLGAVYDDALFRDSAAHDYMLSGGSPCIDAGDPGPAYNDPDGTRNDIGAFPTNACFGAPGPDADGDGTPDSCDVCPDFDDNADADSDGTPDGCDICPGFDDNADTDSDGTPDGCDACPTDPDKTDPLICGCGVSDTDTDGDSVPDCSDICPGFDDALDTDSDGTPDGCDLCEGFDDALDSDSDGLPNACDPCPLNPEVTCCCDTPGDANDNGFTNIADAIFIINMVFDQGPEPSCLDEGDANGNNSVNIADAIHIISAVFNEGPPPACGTTGS